MPVVSSRAGMTVEELDQIVLETEQRDKRWTHDQSATVLEIGVGNREELSLWFCGANDDPDYSRRNARNREKAAARARKSRAARSTGRKRGRPTLDLSPEEKATRIREQNAERQRRRRASRKKPSRDIIDIGTVTHLSVTPPRTAKDSAARPSATAPPTPAVIEILPVAEAELMPQIKIVVPKQPDVVDLILIPKAGRAWARRPPIRAGMLDRYRSQGSAMFGGQSS